MEIGMSGRDFHSNDSDGQHAFAIDNYGKFLILGHELDAQEREGFGEGDNWLRASNFVCGTTPHFLHKERPTYG